MRKVGAVAIGRNEGQRLLDCLKSLRDLALPTVYVDSGSSDGSREARGSWERMWSISICRLAVHRKRGAA